MKFKIPAHIQERSNKKDSISKIAIIVCLLIILISIIISFIIRIFFIYPITIQNDSMEPTLFKGDRFFITYPYLTTIKRGDVVYIEHGENKEQLVCRIFGLENEIISMENNHIYINKAKVDFKNVIVDNRTVPANIIQRDNFPDKIIPKDEYFCLTDNRKYLIDSRFYGSFNKQLIKGKIIFKSIIGNRL